MSLFNNPGRMGGFSAHDYNESELYAWGESVSGRLGNGTQTPDVTAPQHITSAAVKLGQGAISQWADVAAGSGFAHAWTRFGYIYGWGIDSDDAVGDGGSQVNKSSPVYAWGLRRFIAASDGGSHGAIVAGNRADTDQELFTWGGNYNGELGLGHTTNITSVGSGQVSGTTWSYVSCGDQTTAALKTDNTLWTFGLNSNSQLGDGSSADKSSPVQIGSTVWSYVDAGDIHMLGIRTDGTLWAWGSQKYGALGNLVVSGTAVNSPVQIGAATTWTQVAANLNNSAGVQSDGTLWTWGRGDLGALGNGSLASHYSSPVQVGSNTDWEFVDVGGHYMLAITTRGELFAWGQNASGQLGVGDTTTRSSPVQVGTLKNWLQVSCGESGAASFARRR